MNLEALGNLGDFIGGIAVVVTILYLAHQVRQNVKSTHSATYQGIVSSMSSFSRELAFDEERADLFVTGLAHPEELTNSQQTRFSLLMTSYFRCFENIHFQYTAKAIPDDVWQGWEYRIASSLKGPGCIYWWEREQLAYSGRFRKFVNEEALLLKADPISMASELIPKKHETLE